MKCNKCGAEIKDTMKFCNKCGAKVTYEVPKEDTPQVKTKPIQPAEANNAVVIPKTVETPKVTEAPTATVEPPKVTEVPTTTAEPPKVDKSTVVEAPAAEVPAQVKAPKKEKKPAAPLKPKNKVVAGILAILLGFLGIHWFYLEKPIRAIIYLAVYLIFPFVWLLYIVEGIFFLCAKQELFDKYRSFL